MNYRVYVYAISKNEEKFADRWYASMREADGVFVLDTGSTDATVSRLRALGATVEEAAISPWRFDTARNRSLDMVPQDADICVCTDLDEVFSPGWRAQLEKAWHAGAQQARYKYVWSFREDGSEGTVFYIDKIHARNGFFWKNPVHEVLCCQAGEPERVLIEDMQLNHHPDAEKSRAQYLPLLELAVQEDPSNDRNMHYLGREYMFHGRWDDCIRTLKRHLRLPSATWRDERCASLRFIARAYGEKGSAYDQERYLLRAAGEAPSLREPWLDLARFAYAQGDWEGVLCYCRRALRIVDRPRTYISEEASYGSLPYDLLSLAYFHLGMYQQAVWAVNEAVRLSPKDARLRDNLRLMQEKAQNY